MLIAYLKKYRDIIYLILGLIAIVYVVKKVFNIPDREAQYEMEINKLNFENKVIQKNIKLINDSLKKEKSYREGLEKVDKQLSSKKKKKIEKFNEETYKDSSLTDNSVHIVFTRFYEHEDSVYRGFIKGIDLSQREGIN